MNINIEPHKKGDGGLLCMPLVINLPEADKEHKDWKKKMCPSCGVVQCWESDAHREMLEQEKNIKAVCTMCALRAGVMRN